MKYVTRLAILYTVIWFTDLLDLTILNVALPRIAHGLGVDPLDADWAILGFMLAVTMATPLSNWLAQRFGAKSVLVWTQAVYVLATIGCGMAPTLELLVTCRMLQGAMVGLFIPTGLALLVGAIPFEKRPAMLSKVNLVIMLAPAVGPIFAAYVSELLGWRWLFFTRVPLSAFSLFLVIAWIKPSKSDNPGRLDFSGFFLALVAIGSILSALSLPGKLWLLIPGALATALFFVVEKRATTPLVPLSIFRHKLFRHGNLMQAAANLVFLGSMFLIAYFLEEGLGIDMVRVGWLMTLVPVGCIAALPFVARWYNRIGPKWFIAPGLGLTIAAMTMLAFSHSIFVIGLAIFAIGLGANLVRAANVILLFSEIDQAETTTATSIFFLNTLLTASIGVAISTSLLSHLSFRGAVLGMAILPVIGLYSCTRWSNKAALQLREEVKV